MSTHLLDTVRSITKRLGIHRGLRFVYNTAFLSRATRKAEAEGITCTFRTPSRTIAEHVGTFTGEKEILNQFLRLLQPDDVVWDVGAAFGLYTLFAGRQLNGRGSVVAFEPERRMNRLLRRNLELNRLADVTVVPVALGDSDTTVAMYRSDSPNVGTTSLVQRRDYLLKKRGTPVSMRRADSLLTERAFPPPTILKIDVEGAEAKVLDGMGTLLQSPSLRSLFCEVHPHLLKQFDTSEEKLEWQIRQSGLKVTRKHVRGNEYHLICMR